MRGLMAFGAKGPALAFVAAALAGCAGGGMGLPGAPQLAYTHSNAMAPSGYSETQIAPDRYRIQVLGPMTTSRERLEKIAATRAAEIGRDNRLGYFKIDGVQQSTHCEKFTTGVQRSTTGQRRATSYVVLTADVSYAKTPPDPSYRDAKATFDQYRAELDQPSAAPPAVVDPAAAAQCS